MKDIYTESVVPVSPTIRDKRMKYILWGLMGLSVLVFLVVPTVGLITIAVCAFFQYRHLSKMSGEYEYVHTNDIFDVDMVIRNSTRRQLCSIDLNRVEVIAKADSDEIRSLGQLPQTDYSGDADSQMQYAIVYSCSGNLKKLLVQLDEQMHRSLRQWMPGKVK